MQNKMRKQLTIDTSFDEEMVVAKPSPSKIPQYCLKHYYTLKIIFISMLAAFYIASLTMTWLFSPMWASTSLIHRIMTFSCYSFVIMTTDMDEILNLVEGPKQSATGVRGTWWAAMNGYNEYLNYHKGRTEDNRLDSLWFGLNANDNIKALNTAMQFANAV